MTLSDGSQRLMEDVRVGDLVLTAGPGGLAPHQQQPAYRPVYLLAHAEREVDSAFVHLTTANASTGAGGARTRSLRLSQQHYIPVRGPDAATWSYKYAQDVVVGDTVRVLGGGDGGEGVDEALVAHVSRVVDRGLYNPLVFGGALACLRCLAAAPDTPRLGTPPRAHSALRAHPVAVLLCDATGLPVVDGVVASDQSEWVLDDVVHGAAVPQLPRVYGALFAPLRWAYLVLGPRVWGQVIAPAVAYLGHNYGSLLVLHLPALALAAVVARKAMF